MNNDKQTYTGNAGAGMVKVSIDSDFIITKVEIDKEVFAQTIPEVFDDFQFMEDLFLSATNQAIDRAIKDKPIIPPLADLLKGITPDEPVGS